MDWVQGTFDLSGRDAEWQSRGRYSRRRESSRVSLAKLKPNASPPTFSRLSLIFSPRCSQCRQIFLEAFHRVTNARIYAPRVEARSCFVVNVLASSPPPPSSSSSSSSSSEFSQQRSPLHSQSDIWCRGTYTAVSTFTKGITIVTLFMLTMIGWDRSRR